MTRRSRPATQRERWLRRARLLAAAVVLGAPSPVLAGSDSPPLPEAFVLCNDDGCDALVPSAAGPARLCIAARMLRPPAGAPPPLLVNREGRTTPMQRDVDRWCASVAPDAGQLELRSGRRTIEIRVTALGVQHDGGQPDAAAPFVYFQRDDKLAPAIAIAIESRIAKTVAGEPVPAPPTPLPIPQAGPVPDEPDDLAFLDVVAVGDDRGAHCTGIAVARDAVLTAAHCLPATHVDLAINTTQALRSARVRVARVHPMLDAALLHLESALPVVTRARRHAHDARAPSGVMRTVGFGVDDPRKGSGFGIKRRADVAVSSWGCDAGRNLSTGCLVEAEMVIAAIAGRDTCWGDSGGPVLEPHGTSWRLVAITSRPTRHASSACGHGGIYVRVDVIDAWISDALKEAP